MLILLAIACTDAPEDTGPLDALTVVTFNTGTTEGLDHDAAPDDGYTGEHAETSDTWYGDGLAWLPAVEAARGWLAEVDPDVVTFQEIFWSGGCAQIPAEHRGDFVCDGWTEGDPTVAQVILGDAYQVACHPGKPDKCAAVHERLGRFAGCDGGFCLEGLAGYGVDGCGSGARVARGVIERAGADPITVVNVHGSSGLAQDDMDCRVQQVDQVFVDLGDGAPGANGSMNLVMGDLNTDPGRWADFDASAARWGDFVGDGRDFAWISEVGEDAPGTYGGLADIDHVASDVWSGACWSPGGVIEAVYFDHVPMVCEIGR